VYINEIKECIENSKYLFDKLNKMGVPTYLANNSNIVIFQNPSDINFMKKWQIINISDEISSVYVMPNIDKQKIDLFVSEFNDSILKSDLKKINLDNYIDSTNSFSFIKSNL
jgi:hypothetical protein